MHLLMIEDEVGASNALAARLSGAGFRTTSVETCAQAAESASRAHFFAALIDLANTATPPVTLVEPLRANGVMLPLIVLSPRSHWRDKVEALDAGADDYACKPIHSDEVAARLRAVIRRNAGRAGDRVQIGGLDLDLKAHCAWLNGRCLSLSRSEFRLMRLLVTEDCQPVSRDEIASGLAANGAKATGNAVEVLVSRLRQKLGGQMIRTIRGVGYQLDNSQVGKPIDSASCDPCSQSAACCEAEDKGDDEDYVI